MSVCIFNRLFLFMVFLWISVESESLKETQEIHQLMENINGWQRIIHARARACRKLGGMCIKKKKACPADKPLSTPPGKPNCNKRRRCCYPEYTCVPPNFSIIAGTEYGCPCSYYRGTPTDEAIPGRQCCQPTICPNPTFNELHVCGSDDGQACRNAEDALNFARNAWSSPSDILVPWVFSCQGLAYYQNASACYIELPGAQTWSCKIEAGVVTKCEDIGKCWLCHLTGSGIIIGDSLNCE